jgi:hypothetical protein
MYFQHPRGRDYERCLLRTKPRGQTTHLLTQPEVSKHDVAMCINQDVLWFEVTVDDVVVVQVLQRKQNLRRMESFWWVSRAMGVNAT